MYGRWRLCVDHFDLVVKNGTIVDGTGAPSYVGDIAVRDGKIVGPVTSGSYGHFLGGSIGMGYVPAKGQSDDDILGSTYEIEVAGKRHAAVASLVPMYDPKSERIRA